LGTRWILKKGGRFTAHAGVFPFTSCVEGRRMRVAGIGGVATDPSDRGQGYMRTLLDFVDKRVRSEGYALSILWGDRWRYNQFGYECAPLQRRFSFSKRFFRFVPAGQTIRPVRPRDVAFLHRLFSRHPFRNLRTLREQRWALDRHLEGYPGRVLVLQEGGRISAYGVFFHERNLKRWGLAEWGGEGKQVMTLIGHFLHAGEVETVTAIFPEKGDLFREASLHCDEMSRGTFGSMVKILDLGKVLKTFEPQLNERYSENPVRQSGEWSLSLEGGRPVTLSAERALSVDTGRAVKNHVMLKPLDAVRLLFGDLPPGGALSDDAATSRFLGDLFPLKWYWWRSDWI
jgi:hypothetical protein